MSPDQQSAPWMDGVSPQCDILRLPHEVLHTILRMTLEPDLTFYRHQTEVIEAEWRRHRASLPLLLTCQRFRDVGDTIAWSTLSLGYALDTARMRLGAENPSNWSERNPSTILKALNGRPGRCHAVKRVIFYFASNMMVRESPHKLPVTENEKLDSVTYMNPEDIEAMTRMLRSYIQHWPVTKLTLEGGIGIYGNTYATIKQSTASLSALPAHLDEDTMYMRNLDKLVVRGFQVVALMLAVPPRPEIKMAQRKSGPLSVRELELQVITVAGFDARVGNFLRQCTNIKVLKLFVQDGRSPFSGNLAGLGVHSNRDLAKSLEELHLRAESDDCKDLSMEGFTLWHFLRLRKLTLSPYFITLASQPQLSCGEVFASPRLAELELDYSAGLSERHGEMFIDILVKKTAEFVEWCRRRRAPLRWVAVSLPSMGLKRWEGALDLTEYEKVTTNTFARFALGLGLRLEEPIRVRLRDGVEIEFDALAFQERFPRGYQDPEPNPALEELWMENIQQSEGQSLT
ncbi:uncharacterized protein F5Z01DRAFT_669772 [Emericellopsis atlantica]|uniref:Uncharacterized protein n=1 Tax=Emericellopsis atlantica TaxID=2614577 RepID=A0A9P7ZVC7_9HYPO|nr:uncharacterized protein F5Z01DRAFT_669772 [Emericellopsis atlantica]KAG9259039.1 hypothetical protein F5Z01DRAFT_669772 [Emericellopsis atlantica]